MSKQENCPVCGHFMTTFEDAETGDVVQVCRVCLCILLPESMQPDTPINTVEITEP